MDISIDNELFQNLKLKLIEQYKAKYPTKKFKYKRYPFIFD